MIFGQQKSKVGAKNRIAFPKKFREELGNQFVITFGFEKSLMICARNTWEEFIRDTVRRSLLLPEARDLERFLLGGAEEIELDEQGRFVLPKHLKQYCEIRKEGVFVGMRNYIELWDANRWNEYRNLMQLQIRETARRLAERIGDK